MKKLFPIYQNRNRQIRDKDYSQLIYTKLIAIRSGTNSIAFQKQIFKINIKLIRYPHRPVPVFITLLFTELIFWKNANEMRRQSVDLSEIVGPALDKEQIQSL